MGEGVRATWQHLVAGGLGGTVGAVVTCPLEVVKTRLQSSGGGVATVQLGYSRIWSTLTAILLQEGVPGLFRGLGPTLLGVAPARAIYFWAYSTAKSRLNCALQPNTDAVHVLSAASAGLASSCTTNPLWVVKTRMQLEKERGAASLARTVRSIYLERGVRGFWAGISASAYGISETVVHFVIYEKLKRRLAAARGECPGRSKTAVDFLGLMCCGGVSKTVATCLAYPHEVARTRLREAGTKAGLHSSPTHHLTSLLDFNRP